MGAVSGWHHPPVGDGMEHLLLHVASHSLTQHPARTPARSAGCYRPVDPNRAGRMSPMCRQKLLCSGDSAQCPHHVLCPLFSAAATDLRE